MSRTFETMLDSYAELAKKDKEAVDSGKVGLRQAVKHFETALGTAREQLKGALG